MAKTLFIKDLENKLAQEVEIIAWVNTIRDLGKVAFVDLKDSTGRVQAVFDQLSGVSLEDIVKVTGTVQDRELKKEEPGLIPFEIKALKIEVLERAKIPPFPLSTEGTDIDQALRLEYRYLDLRRPRLLNMLRVRHRFVKAVRDFLSEEGFLEIETPLLTVTTPEGARDFVVPSRLRKGEFYALPQSPQQYKQLLMIAGVERYFQIAKCLRDEDLRADRAFEHTQLDLEMSHVNQEDVMNLIERMMSTICTHMGYKLKDAKFPRFTHDQVITQFKSDKFDLRSEEEKTSGDLAFAWVTDYPLFEKTDNGWTFSHNPFTAPTPETAENLTNGHPELVKSLQYDLVLNGFELGSGSIRMNSPEQMKSAFKVMGYNEESIEKNFGHLLRAYEFGSPVHGGIGMGIERPLMVMLNETNLSEVVAFPQTYTGKTSVMSAPSKLDQKILKELGLNVSENV